MTSPTPMDAHAGPWYRDRWPWLLILGPAIVVVAGIATLVIAVRSDDGLVADDYYKRGLAINQVLERVERAASLGLSANVVVASDGRAVVTLEGGGGDPRAGGQGPRHLRPFRRRGFLRRGPSGA